MKYFINMWKYWGVWSRGIVWFVLKEIVKSCIDLYIVLVEGDNMVRREGVWFRRVFGFLDESGGCGGGEKWLDVGYIF